MAAERTLCDITAGLLETFATLACVTPALQEQELGFCRLAGASGRLVRRPAAASEFSAHAIISRLSRARRPHGKVQ
jgi:hypothetical protein